MQKIYYISGKEGIALFEYKSMALSFQSQAQPNKGLNKLFLTEGVTAAVDTGQIDELVNEQAADGWELVTYSPLTSPEHITFIVTFKKAK